MPHAYANTATAREEALRIISQVLQLDANYAAAHAFKAWCHEQRNFRSGFHGEDKDAALLHASLAMTLGKRFASPEHRRAIACARSFA